MLPPAPSSLKFESLYHLPPPRPQEDGPPSVEKALGKVLGGSLRRASIPTWETYVPSTEATGQASGYYIATDTPNPAALRKEKRVLLDALKVLATQARFSAWDLKPIMSAIRRMKDLTMDRSALAGPGIQALPVNLSPAARAALPTSLDESRIRDMMEAAQQAYEANSLAEVSGKNAAVAAYFFPTGQIEAESRFDLTARWFNDPAKHALETGFRAMASKGLPTRPEAGARAVAFAFYGDTPQPQVQTLGYLAQLERGEGADKTLIIRIEDNTIAVRTIRDMMPYVYMSARVPLENA